MSGNSVRTTFTLDFLDWDPWMERATETSLTPERREATEAIVGTSNAGNYINVLANDLEALQARALVHRHVYSSEEPEPSAWRELGATTASRINGCVYCASVHARLYTKYTKRRDVALRFLAEGIDADLPAVERAVVDLAAKLTTSPEALSPADVESLRQVGLDEMTILDVINYTAFFANANRLMLTLGEPLAKP